ncbi:hypothetical protein BSYN_16030 [Bacteroides sedimenti]|uniref:L,D-TPase catalytic domain-containing protein n=2 Tax=Bacteroides sedimenti TaxID=2136147 RepID=A0ABM8IBF5_9BACE
MDYSEFTSSQKMRNPSYEIDGMKVHKYLLRLCAQRSIHSVRDSVLFNFYTSEDASLWLTSFGDWEKINELLHWLENSWVHGLNPEMFSVSKIKRNFAKLRSLNIDERDNINKLIAELEYDLSSAYLRYVCGMSYGFVSPHHILNNIDEEELKPGEVRDSLAPPKMKVYYSIPLKRSNRMFAEKAMENTKNNLSSFLQEVQPRNPFYLSMQKEYIRINAQKDLPSERIPYIGGLKLKEGDVHPAVPLIAEKLIKLGYLPRIEHASSIYSSFSFDLLSAVNSFRLRNSIPTDKFIGNNTIEALNRPMRYYKERLIVNMERMRWQTKIDKGSKYVIVNIAAFMLQAFDEKADSVLEMKICCGSYENKTPLLASRIAYVQMNPYWNVPKSIVRKEIIPAFMKDTAYFERNQMKVYDKEGNEVDPLAVNWKDFEGEIPYSVKQEKGEGNSLGRLIFRFPNAFAVYLHDTPSRQAFLRAERAVSHGCVRLEKPLDFVFFLLKKKDEKMMDKIRIAIDLPPKTEKGKELLEMPGYKPIKTYSFPEMVPLFLDYYTIYPSHDGALNYCKDVYKFDQPILKKLRKL